MDTAATTKSTSTPYVLAIVILFMLGIILIGGVLYLRPVSDPLIVIGLVFGFLVSSGASVGAYLKSQETHLSVNSQLDAWKKEFYAMSYAQGVIDGTKAEQDRIVEQNRVAALAAAIVPPLTAAPIPVMVVSPDPLPVSVAHRTDEPVR